MSYIGNPIVSTDFPVDYFSGNGSTTAFTLSIAPASVNALDVQISGVSQSPQTYSVSGTTLTFSAAPPTGSSNIVVRHQGVAGIPNTPSVASVSYSSLDSSLQNRFDNPNKIINGCMRIDQRNSGASVTAANGDYTLDRWKYSASQASKVTIRQNAGAVTPPTGFTNYLGVTSTSAYTVGTSEAFAVVQSIEGFNIADLGWGTSTAKAVTLSFQIYSSLTGTFGGSITNTNYTRSFPFTYTVSSANTWTSITVTIAGDTTGTWLTNNGVGLNVLFGLGVGSTYSGPAGSWAGTNYNSATGATSVVGTSGATFYITGVDLRKGSYTTAPTFDMRHYTQEEVLCKRYYETLIGAAQAAIWVDQYTNGSNTAALTVPYKVTKRASPTVSVVGSFTTSNTSGAIVLQPSIDGLVAYYSPASAGRIYWYNAANSGFSYSAEL